MPVMESLTSNNTPKANNHAGKETYNVNSIALDKFKQYYKYMATCTILLF